MNIKQFHAHATPYLLQLNDKKYHLNENKLLSFLEEDRLYKVYQAYLKDEEVKHSNKELNKFLDYYCQVLSSKKIKHAFKNFDKKNNSLKKTAGIPLIIGTVFAIWGAVAAVQAIAEEFKHENNLFDAAEEIIEQLTEFNQDYGFGNSQKEADRLLSNLKILVSLYPVISSGAAENSTEAQKFINDTSKFLNALSQSEKDVIVINSYLTENKGWGTHSVEVLRGLGLTLGAIETDAISLARAIGNFQAHSGAWRIKLEKKLSAMSKSKPQIQKMKTYPTTTSKEYDQESEEEPMEDFEQMPAQQVGKAAPTKFQPAQNELNDEIAEFANIKF